MKTQKLSFALVTLCLFAVTAFAGCAAPPKEVSPAAVPYCDADANPKLNVVVKTYFPEDPEPDARATANLAIERGWKQVEITENKEGFYVINGECPQATTNFQSPPTGVPIFTIELRPTTTGCEITPGGIYSPGGNAEWHVNTGSVTIGLQWSPAAWEDPNDGGQKQINTGGEWQSLALNDSSKPFRFCMVLLGDEHEVLTEGSAQTIALALIDTTLLKA